MKRTKQTVVSWQNNYYRFLSDSAPTFTQEPVNQCPVEGYNITLEWKYTFGSGRFHQLQLFGKSIPIVYKSGPGKDPYIAPAYTGRLLANVTDTYTSITFLRVNRTDSVTYTLVLISKSIEIASSQVEISVKCKYKRWTKKFTRKVCMFCYTSVFVFAR